MRAYATILPELRSLPALRSICVGGCVGACLLLTVPAYAVDTLQVTTPDPVTEAWRWTEFDKSSGLAGAVQKIYEDRDGNIWFGTNEGVQRYDGIHWTTYTTLDGLAHNRVRTVLQARDGAMWFGTDGGGISRFDSSAASTSLFMGRRPDFLRNPLNLPVPERLSRWNRSMRSCGRQLPVVQVPAPSWWGDRFSLGRRSHWDVDGMLP